MGPQNNAATDRPSKAATVARGLGWFSIGLGLAEVFMPRVLARTFGVPGHETLIRAQGVREIINGIGILTAPNPKPWIWGRVAGDVLDASTLVLNARSDNAQRSNVAITLGAVAGLTALDVLTAKSLEKADQSTVKVYDYSDRSGLPRSPESMRGLALNDFHVPLDMRAPKLLQEKPIQLH